MHPISDVSSLLQHCIARAQDVTICVCSGRDGFEYIETLLTLDVTRKVKAFHDLSYESSRISKLNRTSFPMIETLLISCGYKIEALSARDFDFGTLDTVTRLRIYAPLAPVTLKFPIIVPPSVQYLELSEVPQKVFVPLLYQCPNLVECSADVRKELDGPPFTKPLILNHLRRLDTGAMNAIVMSSSVQHLLLPSLEFLRLDYLSESSLDIVPFCRSVSATLTSLTMRMHLATSDYEIFYALMSAIRALSPLDGDCNNLRPLHLPALESISWYSDALGMAPRILLDSLKNWWSDEALHLHLEFYGYSRSQQEDWTSGLRIEVDCG
ncbi:hypothetical protein AGABI1DRAFT_127374 [Agaricus bisporus var. burnettii JB137-S8]|uniref:F-box domain-containing protein n=1 Tax=Agaricus bisporus var. burnettii (strain JB137-S8 / ATCC MYA-4627 / FGSC 10392) TaxID=597362 RepID=K5XDE7_AGABU|nr:uncharacterized protein AGABI1DRAFT_127374 [Agaricus bisporus var. burnettii JB137-S8]EKM81368.1 hypothetical protein AGABI1DRAFT_127374 [Agaricus bisporus var. burnettii JB137-S8]